MSADPALNKYLPSNNREQKLPGMGGVFNPPNLNLYSYVGNVHALNAKDPTGEWAVVDDALFFFGGGLIGVSGRVLIDLQRNKITSWADGAGAFAGGAVAGEATLYSANPIVGGMLGGAAGNIVTNFVKSFGDEPENLDPYSLLVDTGVGGLTAGLLKGVPLTGVNAGRNSMNSIFTQMVAKFENKTIKDVTAKTAGKMFAGAAYDQAMLPGAIIGAAASDAYSASSNQKGSFPTIPATSSDSNRNSVMGCHPSQD